MKTKSNLTKTISKLTPATNFLRIFTIMAAMILLSNITFAQVVSEEDYDEQIEPINYMFADEKPSFPDGDAGILRYIQQNTVYPPMAKELNIQGRVFVEFVVDQYGKVTNAKVLMGVDPLLDAEAVRVIGNMPDWTPGKYKGKAVPVKNILPINFRLEKNDDQE